MRVRHILPVTQRPTRHCPGPPEVGGGGVQSVERGG